MFTISKSRRFFQLGPGQPAGLMFLLGLLGLMSKSVVFEISTSLILKFLQLFVSILVILKSRLEPAFIVIVEPCVLLRHQELQVA